MTTRTTEPIDQPGLPEAMWVTDYTRCRRVDCSVAEPFMQEGLCSRCWHEVASARQEREQIVARIAHLLPNRGTPEPGSECEQRRDCLGTCDCHGGFGDLICDKQKEQSNA